MNKSFTMLRSGSTVSAQFADKKFAHRYVIQKSGVEKIDWCVKWDADNPGIIRCIVQAPDGRVLYDGSNEGCGGALLYPSKTDNNLHGTIYASAAGLYSVFVSPISLCSAKFEYGVSQTTSLRDERDDHFTLRITGMSSEHHLWTTTSRRRPCIFVVDRGKSMTIEDIDAAERSISSAVNRLRGDPMALETVHIACISFSSGALIHSSMKELCSYELPIIGRDPFNDSNIEVALNSIAFFHTAYLIPASASAKGDWRANVFLFTNGKCLSGIRDMVITPKVNLIICMFGECSLPDNMDRLTQTVLRMSDVGDFGSNIGNFFRIVS